MKKMFALILAIVMVMGLATTVMAAEKQEVSVGTTRHTYEIYQIFEGTQTAEDATLTDIKWGSAFTDSDASAFLAALKADTKIGSYFSSSSTATDVAGVLASNNSVEMVYNGFANIAVYYIQNPLTNITITDETIEVELDAGYYLFLDVTENLPDGDAYNPALLQVTKAGKISISKKYGVPVTEKTIWDGSQYGVELIDAMIGEKVTFQIVGSVADGMGHYTTYKYIIHDNLPDGAKIDESSVKVYLAKNASPNELYLINSSSYTLNVDNEDGITDCEAYPDAACNMEVTFSNLRSAIQIATTSTTVANVNNVVEGETTYNSYTVSGTDDIWVIYDAVLDEDARIWLEESMVYNENSARIEFSNDPNWTDDPDDDDDEPPTGITPESEARVYTTQVTVEKVDESKNPLTGAVFQLSGTSMKPILVYGTQFVEVDEDDFAEGETKYWLLTDGTYTDVDPNGENVDSTVYANDDKLYALREVAITSEYVENVSVTAEVGEDGVLKFAGLGAGTYTLTEITPPAGYNKLDKDITLVITFHPEDNNKFKYSWKHEGEETILSATYKIQLVNTKGSVLPETGGMGTTIFYATGSVMVLAAVVLLITKKRMSVKN